MGEKETRCAGFRFLEYSAKCLVVVVASLLVGLNWIYSCLKDTPAFCYFRALYAFERALRLEIMYDSNITVTGVLNLFP